MTEPGRASESEVRNERPAGRSPQQATVPQKVAPAALSKTQCRPAGESQPERGAALNETQCPSCHPQWTGKKRACSDDARVES
jgi:hypothetical protein